MSVTRNEMEHAASMVRAIMAGKWTDDVPDWAEPRWDTLETVEPYMRAVQTAEAFIMFFQTFNPAFDQQRFLVACGLVEPAVKRGKA